MNAPTVAEIRQVVALYSPERLDCYDHVTGSPLPRESGSPIEWTSDMRMTVALHMWTRYNGAQPN